MKQVILLLALCLSGTLLAHQSDVSTTMLVEKEPGTWQLYVNSSLTAFEYEVKSHFGEHAFDSPEAFEELVLQHLRKTISVSFDGGEPVALTEGSVKLGHETGVTFMLANVPTDPGEVYVRNTAFSDIHRNMSILLFLKKDREKVQLELNADNDHSVELDLRGEEIREVAAAGFLEYIPTALPLLLLGLLIIGGVGLLGSRTKLFDHV